MKLLTFTLLPLALVRSATVLDNVPESTLFPVSIATILRRHFFHPYEAILLHLAFNGSASAQQQGDLVNNVLRLTTGELVIQFYYPRKNLVRPRFYNVFFVDGYDSFRKIYETMHYKTYEFSGYYLVVIAGEIEEVLEDLIKSMLDDLWLLDVFNVNIVTASKAHEEVLIYTFFPYTVDHCGVVSPILWHNFTSVEWTMEETDLYPNRLQSFHGCPLIGGTFEAKPYTIIPKLQVNSSEVTVSGFEGDLVDLLAVKLKFKVHYEISPEAWGFARKRGESTGLMKMIQEDQVDFGVGCMAFAYDRHYYLKPGIAHYTSKVLFAVPAGRPFTAFEKLFRPFSPTIWSLIVVYLAVGATVIYLLQFTSRQTQEFIFGFGICAPYLNVLNIFFGGGLERFPDRNFARTLLMLWIYFCFVIRTLYQGSLYLYLQRTLSHAPLETMSDIDRSGIQYYMMEIGQRYFVTMPHVLERTTYIVPGKDSLGKTVENLGRGMVDGVVLIPLDHAAYHNKIFSQDEFVHVAKEHVGVYPVGFYYPKKSRLTKVFDDQIRNIQSTGLIEFWIRRYGDYDFFRKKVESSGPRQLSNHHLAGGYQVFISWLAISVAIFIVELLTGRSETLRRMLQIIAG